MARLARLLAGACFFFCIGTTHAVECSVPWSVFRFEGSGPARCGHVIVSGTQNEAGITSLRIEAFGKTFTLIDTHIQKLRGVHANSMQLTFEPDYPKYGGAKLFVWVGIAFPYRLYEGKIITVNERGDINVIDGPTSDPSNKALQPTAGRPDEQH